MLAARKAREVIQSGREWPLVRKSELEVTFLRRNQPMPRTNPKYRARMT